jgi:hypothetical protein
VLVTPLGEGRGTPLSDARYESFVVRVLRQGSGGGYSHGQVTHIASRRSKRFTDLKAVVGFILTQLGTPAPDSPTSEPPK